MVKKTLFFLLIISFLLTTTSCWDNLEIEHQAFIIGMAIDKAENSDEIMVTFQIAQPQAFVTESQVAEPFWNITETARDITTARNNLVRSINWIPTFEHCQVVLIGEDMAREGLDQQLDFALRTHEIRRKLQIGVVQGKAKDILEMKFKSGLIPSFVVSEMMYENSSHSYGVTDFMDISKLHTAFVEGYDFMLCRIVPMEGKLDMSGGAVFKNFKLVGWFSGEELTGARFLRGDAASGFLVVDLPSKLGDRVMLRVFEAKTNLKPEIRDGKLYAVLDIRLEGDITEIINSKSELSDSEFIKQCKVLFVKYVENNVLNTFKKAQHEFASDPFRLKEKLMSYYPEFWSANQDSWDEIYQAAELEINAEVRIRRLGEIKR